jgi:hypothetical protein
MRAAARADEGKVVVLGEDEDEESEESEEKELEDIVWRVGRVGVERVGCEGRVGCLSFEEGVTSCQ